MMHSHIDYDTLKMFVRTTAFADHAGSAGIGMSSTSYQELQEPGNDDL